MSLSRILRMRIISAIMNFYWSHAIPLQKLSDERSYKFSWILTLTEVISIRNFRFFDRQNKWRPLITPWLNVAEPNWQSRKIVRDDDNHHDTLAFQYSRLWVICTEEYNRITPYLMKEKQNIMTSSLIHGTIWSVWLFSNYIQFLSIPLYIVS